MGVLRSDEFKGDPKLEACATIPGAHLLVGTSPGPHILKLQLALERLWNAKRLPHAWTVASQPDPKTHLCEPFFTSDPLDLQRDVITHEYFHIQGLQDIHVANTADALRNANTIAQIVAFLADRFRQVNSDGNEPAIRPLPSP
jgi:hypothetical protein